MKEFNKITSKQLAEKGVQALADRPNAHGQYGQGGMSPQQLKIWFDKLATFLAGKINELYGAMSGEDAAYYVRLALDDYEVGSLGDLVESMLSGDFAGRILQVFPSANSFEKVTLQKYIYDIAQKMSTFSEICEESAKGEVDRKTAEEVRKNNEITRIQSEIIRQTEETSRVTNELERISAENSRKRDETERKETVGKVDNALNEILKVQQLFLSGNAELVAKEEVIKAINENMLIANDLETDDPYKALSAAQGVALYNMLIYGEFARIETGYYNGTGIGNVELLLSYRPKVILILGNIRYPDTNNITSSVIERSWHLVLPEYEMYVSNGSVVKTDDIAINGTDVEFPCANKKSYYRYNPPEGGSTQTHVDTAEDGYGYWYYAFE